MNCPSFVYENRDTARFCGDCAQPLSATVACPDCGVENPRGQRFCDECGRALAPATSPAPVTTDVPSTLAGGRYQLRRFLGEGAEKRVHLARDRTINGTYVLASPIPALAGWRPIVVLVLLMLGSAAGLRHWRRRPRA